MYRLHVSGWRALAAGSALAVLASACASNAATSASGPGGSAPGAARPASLNVELDWVPNPDHSGLYYAQNKGYFARQKLTVNFRVPSSAADPLKLVGLNHADLAVSYEPEMFYAQQEGLPVVAVAAIIPVPLNGLIVSPKVPMTSPCQIRGHSVGFTGVPSDSAFYDTLLHTCHLSAAQVPHQSVGYNLVPSVLSGKVDAIIGGYRNVEAVQISQEMGKRAAYFPATTLGVPAYDELVLVANARRLASDPGYASAVRRFVAGSVAGTRAAVKTPGEAKAILQTASQYKPSFLHESVPLTLKLLEEDHGMKTGCLSLHAWRSFGNWMKAHKLIKHAPDASAIMTDKYLPHRTC
jgi:putative hydroxymethylpyrimidine transport system substrate-binding protein